MYLYLCLHYHMYGNIGLFVLSHFHAFPFRALPPLHPCPVFCLACPLNKPQTPLSCTPYIVRISLLRLWYSSNYKIQNTKHTHKTQNTTYKSTNIKHKLQKYKPHSQMHPLYSLHRHISFKGWDTKEHTLPFLKFKSMCFFMNYVCNNMLV